MGISLIVTKSFDQNFEETGEEIVLNDWLKLIESDNTLRIRTAPHTLEKPTAKGIVAIPASPGESELLIGDHFVAFLGYREGELAMKYSEDRRRKEVPSTIQRVMLNQLGIGWIPSRAS